MKSRTFGSAKYRATNLPLDSWQKRFNTCYNFGCCACKFCTCSYKHNMSEHGLKLEARYRLKYSKILPGNTTGQFPVFPSYGPARAFQKAAQRHSPHFLVSLACPKGLSCAHKTFSKTCLPLPPHCHSGTCLPCLLLTFLRRI